MILNPYSLFNTNWVGFGDTADYRALELLDSGSYNFTVSQLAGKATGKFTLWKLRDDGKLRKMFTVNAGSKKPAAKSNVLLESGSYVIAFESKNWKSGHNTDYTVMLDGTAFGQANRREDNDWQHATAVTEGEAVREEWVGFSDLKDYFRFEVARRFGVFASALRRDRQRCEDHPLPPENRQKREREKSGPDRLAADRRRPRRNR